MSASVKIQGLRSTMLAIEALPEELRRSSEMTALREGAKPILSAAKGMVPSVSGLLKESLGITVRKVKSGALKGELTARVGPRGGFRKQIGTYKSGKKAGKGIFQDPVRYAHLVELGTSHSPARPFMRPATESASSQIVAAVASGYSKGLNRAIKKLRKS